MGINCVYLKKIIYPIFKKEVYPLNLESFDGSSEGMEPR